MIDLIGRQQQVTNKWLGTITIKASSIVKNSTSPLTKNLRRMPITINPIVIFAVTLVLPVATAELLALLNFDMIQDRILHIAERYSVSVKRDSENCLKNQAACAGRSIFLGVFSDPEIELVAFFHELGHVMANELVLKRGYVMCTLSSEGSAWELGLGIAFMCGYKWDYYSNEMEYDRNQLKTYVKNKNNYQ